MMHWDGRLDSVCDKNEHSYLRPSRRVRFGAESEWKERESKQASKQAVFSPPQILNADRIGLDGVAARDEHYPRSCREF